VYVLRNGMQTLITVFMSYLCSVCFVDEITRLILISFGIEVTTKVKEIKFRSNRNCVVHEEQFELYRYSQKCIQRDPKFTH
jgi:hypothetical protein